MSSLSFLLAIFNSVLNKDPPWFFSNLFWFVLLENGSQFIQNFKFRSVIAFFSFLRFLLFPSGVYFSNLYYKSWFRDKVGGLPRTILVFWRIKQYLRVQFVLGSTCYFVILIDNFRSTKTRHPSMCSCQFFPKKLRLIDCFL